MTFITDNILSEGSISGVTVSATTFYGNGANLTGIPDTSITGGTADNTNKLYTFTNNTGGTFNVTALTDIRVTGGTYSNGTATFTNNTGGTFTVNGFSTGIDTFTTGFTYSNNVFSISNSTGGTLSVLVNQMSALTSTTISATSVSATTITGDGTGITNVGLRIKSSGITASLFAGNPKKYTVAFVSNFATTGYSVTINAGDNRNWTYESKVTSGFTINANANAALTQPVLWTAIQNGEY